MALVLHVTLKDAIIIGDSIVYIKDSRKGRVVLAIDAPKELLIRRVKTNQFNTETNEIEEIKNGK